MERELIHGSVEPGFEAVEKEFRRNFAERGELGAACAIYHRGKKVVDLWGGYRDHKTYAPWKKDMLVLVFSATKGMAAIALAVAHSQGLLDYDEQVAAYWPEFAQCGKESITVRQLLAHQAGLSAIDEPLDLEIIADPDALAETLARQEPAWEPGTRYGYHCWTLGWYESELIRRADPQRRRLGQFFHDEVAHPLGLEFYVGLPADVPDSRIANIKPASLPKVLLNLDRLEYIKRCLNPFQSGSITYRSVMNPRVLTGHGNYNRREVRAVEIPSANGIGQVRSMAKAYSVFATGGKELDLGEGTLQALYAPATPPPAGAFDEVLRVESAYSLGFRKPCASGPFGSSDSAFGFAGAGGSLAFADPEAQVGYAYAPNRIGVYLFDDPREKSLRDACYRCIEGFQ